MAEALEGHKVAYEYESFKIEYEVPSRRSKYTPDFRLPNGIIVEAKGLWDAADRAKHVWIKAQHPSLDIRFVFQNSKNKLYRGSPTTYAMWCEKWGFKYADKEIPIHWIKERPKDGRTTSDTSGQAHPPAPRKA